MTFTSPKQLSQLVAKWGHELGGTSADRPHELFAVLGVGPAKMLQSCLHEGSSVGTEVERILIGSMKRFLLVRNGGRFLFQTQFHHKVRTHTAYGPSHSGRFPLPRILLVKALLPDSFLGLGGVALISLGPTPGCYPMAACGLTGLRKTSLKIGVCFSASL